MPLEVDAMRSGGDKGLKPYNASKGGNLGDALSYYSKIQRVAKHVINRCVEHERNLVEFAQWFYVCVQFVHRFADDKLKTY